jgi:hypothetical protein
MDDSASGRIRLGAQVGAAASRYAPRTACTAIPAPRRGRAAGRIRSREELLGGQGTSPRTPRDSDGSTSAQAEQPVRVAPGGRLRPEPARGPLRPRMPSPLASAGPRPAAAEHPAERVRRARPGFIGRPQHSQPRGRAFNPGAPAGPSPGARTRARVPV